MYFRKPADNGRRSSDADTATPREVGHPVPRRSDASDQGGTEAVDALSAVLRTLGEHVVVANEDAKLNSERYDAWARHALIGVAPPGVPARPTGTATESTTRRDWSGLRRFVTGRRVEEKQFVARIVEDLRATVLFVVANTHQVALRNAKDHGVAQAQLDRLKAALRRNDMVAVREEATRVIDVVEGVFAKQRSAFRSERSAFVERIRTLGQQLETERQEGSLDSMTRLHNRASFDAYLERSVELSSFLNMPCLLLLVDIDNFKSVNDTHGHAVGDKTIRAIADTLSRTFPRRSDFVARFGGDEFAAILRDVRVENAKVLGDRLVRAIRETSVVDASVTVRPTASIGIAAPGCPEAASDWFRRADSALYRAKAAGRDRWAVAEDP
ncbi:MAG: GGDEF domain-containing protein [Polyangiaceae bacterium]